MTPVTHIDEPISETAKYRHLTEKYCVGCGLDVASQGDPVVPWAWQLDLPQSAFDHYNSGHEPHGPIQLRGYADKLPVGDASLDFLYSSHLLEDFPEDRWPSMFKEWCRVIKPGGHLIILIPDRGLWVAACARGQTPNDAHRREGEPGLMSKFAIAEGMSVIEDRLTECFEGDYTIMGVFKKA